MTPRSTLLPSLAVAASGLIWGIWWLPLRQLEGAGLVGNWANLAVYALAALITAPFAFVLRRRVAAQFRALVVIGLISGTSLCLWNYALLTGNVVRVTLLFYLAPVWCTALSLVVFREPVRAMRLLTIVGGLAGAAVLVGIEKGGAAALSPADGMALLSSLSFACLTVYVRKVGGDVGGWEKTFFTTTVGALTAFIAVTLLPEGPVPALGDGDGGVPGAAALHGLAGGAAGALHVGHRLCRERPRLHLSPAGSGRRRHQRVAAHERPLRLARGVRLHPHLRRRPARRSRRDPPREALVNRILSVISWRQR
jgi:drug/metabolite transporter (DMT)-like permease